MTTPIDPVEPPSSTAPQPAAFSRALPGSKVLRLGVVLAASLVLLVSAALTFGASPAPSGASPNGGTQDPSPGTGQPKLRDRGIGGGFRFGLGGGARFGFGDITVTAIDGSNLSLKTDDGWTRTIAVTGNTKITRGGAASALGDIKAGDHIRFHETRNADGTFTIDAVNVVLPHVVGKVTAKTADTITVERVGGGSVTIHVDGSTTYRVAGKQNAGLTDVAVGAVVGAQGELRADGSLDATTVGVAPKPGRWFGGRDGRVGKPKPAPNATGAPNATPGSYSAG